MANDKGPISKEKRAATEKMVMNTLLRDPSLIANAITSRADLMQRLMDPRRDINEECGYPNKIDEQQFRVMYDREIGRRVVNIYPEETWKRLPEIYEDADLAVTTPFEKSLKALDDRLHLLHFLQRADELSGIGQYGVILWGLNDGKTLDQPVEGWEQWEEVSGNPRTSKAKAHRLLYIRVFDASLVRISSYEQDTANPRYGLPTEYTLTLQDPRNTEPGGAAAPVGMETRVHWTRVTHVVDNRGTSEVMGTPRMEPVWNRLYDLRKVLGGSGEMYWRGGFPGVSLETQPGMENAELDVEATREVMYNYMNGLQRYIALTGMSAKSLSPQIADPGSSFEVHIKAICVTLGVPYRVFMGIEEGVVSGDQATNAWNSRLVNRQSRYITPMLIDPVLQRLVEYGVLDAPSKPQGWTVEWPDLTAPSDMDKAEVGAKRTEAFAKYVGGGVDTLVPPLEFLTIICGLEQKIAEEILKAAIEHIEDGEDKDTPPPPASGATRQAMSGNRPEEEVVTAVEKAKADALQGQSPEKAQKEALEDAAKKVVKEKPDKKAIQNASVAEEGDDSRHPFVDNYSPKQPRDKNGRFAGGGGSGGGGLASVLAGDASKGQYKGPKSSDDIKTLVDLEVFAAKAVGDDLYTHGTTAAALDGILAEGLKGGNQKGVSTTSTMVDTGGQIDAHGVRTKSSSSPYVVIEGRGLPRTDMTDVVAADETYPETRFHGEVPKEHIVKVVGTVTDKSGFQIREDRLASYALANQGLDNKDVKDLPAKYQKWFSLAPPLTPIGNDEGDD